MLCHAVDELSTMLKQVSESAGTAGSGAKVSAELLQQTVHTALYNMSELVAIAAKTQSTVVAKRVHEHVEQWTRLMRHS